VDDFSAMSLNHVSIYSRKIIDISALWKDRKKHVQLDMINAAI
jgi:hypothetical protein